MIAHGIALFVGFLLLCAGTHVAVLASGGYGTPQSYVAIAVAAGVGCGSVFCRHGVESTSGDWLAVFLGGIDHCWRVLCIGADGKSARRWI